MRLHRVHLLNYRGVANCEVKFSTSGVTIIEGQNEIGKTCIPEALQLAIDLPDSSQQARVNSIKPVDRDAGPEVEITLSSGEYEFVYRKRWLRQPETTLEVKSPHNENLTGRKAHDRVQEILAQTLDDDLWRALRIEQGTELTLPPFDLPSMGRALDRAAGGDLTTDREDILWNRIGEEYGKYWTSKGRAKEDRKSLERTVVETQDEVRKLKERLDDIESDATHMSWLVTEAKRLALTRTECEKQESDLAKRWESTQRLSEEAKRLAAVYDAAKAECDRASVEQQRRQELVDALDTRNETLAKLQAEAEQAAPSLAAATRHSQKANTALDSAIAELRSTESRQRLANDDLDYRRRQIEIEQLTERHDRYTEASKLLREAEGFLEGARVDDDLVTKIEQAYLAHERAKAAAASSAPSVETTALRDITVHFDGKEIDLAGSQVHRTPVDGELVLLIPDIARISVSAAAESRELAHSRSKSQETLKRLCDEGDVANLAEARVVAQQRREAEYNRKEAQKAIQRDLRDLTPEVILNKIKGLSKWVTSYPGERPEEPALPADFEEAKLITYEIDDQVAHWKDEHHTCEATAKNAEEAFREAQLAEQVLAARIKDARASREAAVSDLGKAREKQPDEALTATLSEAQRGMDQARKSLEESQARLKAADPDSLEVLLENARAATKRAAEELQINKEQQNKLRISLDLRGEEGLHTLHDEALNQLRHIRREREGAETRAEAARLLKEIFSQHRQQSRQRYMEPFKERIDQLGRIGFGPTFAVELDDDLRVVRRTLDDVTLDVDQLSAGAREQLGVLVRLACATIISPDDGGAPVMIDDSLGWSDPKRLQTMGAAIAAAGKRCQVIVLTCTPGRYSNVGKANVITLGNLGAQMEPVLDGH